PRDSLIAGNGFAGKATRRSGGVGPSGTTGVGGCRAEAGVGGTSRAICRVPEAVSVAGSAGNHKRVANLLKLRAGFSRTGPLKLRVNPSSLRAGRSACATEAFVRLAGIPLLPANVGAIAARWAHVRPCRSNTHRALPRRQSCS